MEIREATHRDIPEIVSLLKSSLGESLLPKSEKVWRFKHVDNPFGESLVLLAILEGKIIGVRAFMRWSWMLGDTEYKVYRAVDTGVLPEHQGQGIFRKLNLRAVEIAREKGDHFIFNTPNSQSLPGNLKMGWNKIQKIKIRLAPSKLYHFFLSSNYANYKVDKKASAQQFEELLSVHINKQERGGKLFTPKTPAYLQWRYEDNPLQKYEVSMDADFYLSGYLKDHKYFTELRITEHIFKNEEGLKKIKTAVKNWSSNFKSPIISYSPELKLSSPGFSGNFGPILTLRNLNLDKETEQHFLQMKNWEYTLGDLELF